MAAVYGIVHLASMKTLVGSVGDGRANTIRLYKSTKAKLSKRFREHRCLLNQGKHAEPELQNDWNQYGPSAFAMRLLEEIEGSVESKREAELRWMANLDKQGLLYNQTRLAYALSPEAMKKGVEASRHVIGNRWTPEANEKRRLAQLGKPKGHGAKISATKRAKRMMRWSSLHGDMQEVSDKEPT
jgi:hypothetical protein